MPCGADPMAYASLMKLRHLLLPLALFLPAACDRGPAHAPPSPSSTAPQTAAAPDLQRQDWNVPATTPAAQPDLVGLPDGSLLLSWIEPQAGGHALKFARFAKGAWSQVRTIARGDDWFVNWADTPHIAQTPDGALWAHWLQKSANAKYAYDIAMVRSQDGGTTWSAPVLVNDDGTAAEHGFVSLWPAANDRIGVAWLDGRNSAGGGHHGHEGHHEGTAPSAMTLRTAVFDAAFRRHDEREVDAMTCDCCQTDVASTAAGALLVYRDRTPDEIRDILAVRLQGGHAAVPVHADGWVMPACPVNGPAVAASARDVVVGWYTGTGDVPTVKLARSVDAGATFDKPQVLERGAQVQGRIDVAIDAQSAWALWLREDANGQSLQLARYSPDLSRELQRTQVATLQGRGRGTGFAKLALVDGAAHVVWTDVVEQKPRLHGARFVASP